MSVSEELKTLERGEDSLLSVAAIINIERSVNCLTEESRSVFGLLLPLLDERVLRLPHAFLNQSERRGVNPIVRPTIVETTNGEHLLRSRNG